MASQPLGFQIEGKTFDFSFEGHGKEGSVKVVERAQKKTRRVRLSPAMAQWIAGVLLSETPAVGLVTKKRFGRALALIKARSNSKGSFLEIGVAHRGRFEAIFVPHGRRNENWKELGRFLRKSIAFCGDAGQDQATGDRSPVKTRSNGRQLSYQDVVVHKLSPVTGFDNHGSFDLTRSEGHLQKETSRGVGCATCGRRWPDQGLPHAGEGSNEQTPPETEARETHAPGLETREPHAPVRGSEFLQGLVNGCDFSDVPSINLDSSSSGLQWSWNGFVLNLALDFNKIFSSVLQRSISVAMGSLGQHACSHGEPLRDRSTAREDSPGAPAEIQQPIAERVEPQEPETYESGDGQTCASLGGSDEPLTEGMENEAANCGRSLGPFHSSEGIVTIGGHNATAETSGITKLAEDHEGSDQDLCGDSLGDGDSSYYEDYEDEGLLLETLRGFYDDDYMSYASEAPTVELQDTHIFQEGAEHPVQNDVLSPPPSCEEAAGDDQAQTPSTAQDLLEKMGLKLVDPMGKDIDAVKVLGVGPMVFSRARKGLRELKNLQCSINYEGRGLTRGFLNRK